MLLKRDNRAAAGNLPTGRSTVKTGAWAAFCGGKSKLERGALHARRLPSLRRSARCAQRLRNLTDGCGYRRRFKRARTIRYVCASRRNRWTNSISRPCGTKIAATDCSQRWLSARAPIAEPSGRFGPSAARPELRGSRGEKLHRSCRPRTKSSHPIPRRKRLPRWFPPAMCGGQWCHSIKCRRLVRRRSWRLQPAGVATEGKCTRGNARASEVLSGLPKVSPIAPKLTRSAHRF